MTEQELSDASHSRIIKAANGSLKFRPSKRIKAAWRASQEKELGLSLRQFARQCASCECPLDAIATAWLDSKAKR